MHLYPWAAWLVIAVLLAGCSAQRTESTDGSRNADVAGSAKEAQAPDACAVLTAEEIEQVLGVAAKIQQGDHLKTIATTSLCNYESADGHGLVSVLIRISAPGLDPQTNRQQYLAGIKNNMGDSYRIDPVDGLSAPALWNPDMRQLTAFKGSALIIVTMSDARGKDALEAAKALVEKGLADIS